MSSVSITITFGRFCSLFCSRSRASFSRCVCLAAWQALSHLAEAWAGEAALAQANAAAQSAAAAKPAPCRLPQLIRITNPRHLRWLRRHHP